MSTQILNLTVTPDFVNASDGAQVVRVSWDALMTAATDNPINIELNILPENPVFFVSNRDRNIKAVAWQQNFNEGFHHYEEDVFIIVTQPQTRPQATDLRMDIVDSRGVRSSDVTSLMYQ